MPFLPRLPVPSPAQREQTRDWRSALLGRVGGRGLANVGQRARHQGRAQKRQLKKKGPGPGSSGVIIYFPLISHKSKSSWGRTSPFP